MYMVGPKIVQYMLQTNQLILSGLKINMFKSIVVGLNIDPEKLSSTAEELD